MDDVPPHLGTVTEYRKLGMRIKPGTRPLAEVTIRHGQHEPLYTVHQVEQVPGINDDTRKRLSKNWFCQRCGKQDRNRMGKILLPGPGGLCHACRNPTQEKRT